MDWTGVLTLRGKRITYWSSQHSQVLGGFEKRSLHVAEGILELTLSVAQADFELGELLLPQPP